MVCRQALNGCKIIVPLPPPRARHYSPLQPSMSAMWPSRPAQTTGRTTLLPIPPFITILIHQQLHHQLDAARRGDEVQHTHAHVPHERRPLLRRAVSDMGSAALAKLGSFQGGGSSGGCTPIMFGHDGTDF